MNKGYVKTGEIGDRMRGRAKRIIMIRNLLKISHFISVKIDEGILTILCKSLISS